MALNVQQLNMVGNVENSIIDTGTITTIKSDNVMQVIGAGSVEMRGTVDIKNNSITGCNKIHSANNENLKFETTAVGSGVQIRKDTTTFLTVNNTSITFAHIPRVINTAPKIVASNLDPTDILNWNNFTSYTTFNPVLYTASGTIGEANYSYRRGYYVQVGNMIFFNLAFRITGKGELTGSTETARILLPVQIPKTTCPTNCFAIGAYSGITVSGNCVSSSNATNTNTHMVITYKPTPGSQDTSTLAMDDINNSFTIALGGCYYLTPI